MGAISAFGTKRTLAVFTFNPDAYSLLHLRRKLSLSRYAWPWWSTGIALSNVMDFLMQAVKANF